MKRLFALIFAIILVVSLCSITALADTVYSDCEHVNSTVTASEDGYFNIVFSDGYNGFCICYGDEDAAKDDVFTIHNMSLVVNHNTNENVSDYLKVMFVDYFDLLFSIDTTSNTCSITDIIKPQYMIWHFTNDFTNWRVDPQVVANIRSTASNRTEPIPDHGYTKKVSDTLQAVFDFHALEATGRPGHQNFWAYKVTLIPYPAPEVTSPTEPQTKDVISGQSVELSVTATNAESYQWQVDTGDGSGFTNIEGATNATYTTPASTTDNAGYRYQCVVTNTAGSDTSPLFSLNRIIPPEITTPEADTIIDVYAGKTATLSITATNAESYQWQVDTGSGYTNIDGATEVSYTIPTITAENSDYKYQCIVTNPAGSDTSPVFALNMIPAPAITAPTTDQAIRVGIDQSVIFAVTATNAETYQWQVDSGDGFMDITGTVNDSYTVPATSNAENGNKYRCIAANPAGTATSPVFTLEVVEPPVITNGTEDKKVDVEKGKEMTLTVEATSGDTYQWQVDTGDGFKDIAGATSPSYTVPTNQDGKIQYRCVVSNAYGQTISATFTVNVYIPASTPATGDSSSIGLWMAMMLLSLCAAAVILRKQTA